METQRKAEKKTIFQTKNGSRKSWQSKMFFNGITFFLTIQQFFPFYPPFASALMNENWKMAPMMKNKMQKRLLVQKIGEIGGIYDISKYRG